MAQPDYSIPEWITNPSKGKTFDHALTRMMEMAQQKKTAENADSNQKAELGLRQKEYADKATEASRKYQAQQGYSDAIAGGMDPVEAIVKFGPAMGGQGVPEAAALRSKQIQKDRTPTQAPTMPQSVQAPIEAPSMSLAPVPADVSSPAPDISSRVQARIPDSVKSTVTPVTDKAGNPIPGIGILNGKMIKIPTQDNGNSGKISDVDKYALAQSEKTLKAIEAATIKNAKEPNPSNKATTARALMAQREQAQSEKDRVLSKYQEKKKEGDTKKSPTAALAKQAAPGYVIGTKYKGGLTYLGGDPNNEDSWKKE